jgi:hypothetical protein
MWSRAGVLTDRDDIGAAEGSGEGVGARWGGGGEVELLHGHAALEEPAHLPRRGSGPGWIRLGSTGAARGLQSPPPPLPPLTRIITRRACRSKASGASKAGVPR